MKKIYTVKVIFEDNDFLITRINAETRDEIESYYLGRIFNVGTVNDELKRCTAIELLEA